ncbi:MAG: endolytic transglycosylase MltG [Actinomycetota bacterium]|nr:endolytic transglycosylase MltG [Actinomycetota bacterium]
MAHRPDYVRHRRRSSRSGRYAALAGVAVAAAALGAIVWGFSAALGVGDDDEPATTAATTTVPQKPVLKIVFPEGFTRDEMARRIAAVNRIAKQKRKITPKLSPAAYRRATRRGKLPDDFTDEKLPDLEGFLFPATYEFTEDTTSRALVRKQLDAFERAWAQVDLKYAKSKNLTAYEVLIIASMVEEEVQVPHERELVAAVIYNRLRVGLTLGIDATIRYGLDIPPTEPIHQSELESDTPYNTRKFLGLPPTPISNPGLAAIQAAAHPAQIDYLYFIRKPDCKSHFFTASEEEFFSFPRAGLSC